MTAREALAKVREALVANTGDCLRRYPDMSTDPPTPAPTVDCGTCDPCLAQQALDALDALDLAADSELRRLVSSATWEQYKLTGGDHHEFAAAALRAVTAHLRSKP